MELAVFVVSALVAVVSALVVVLHRNPVYSVMSLVVTLISTALLFVLLGAPFLAAVQVLVYAGAILVLFLFVIMLLSIEQEKRSTVEGRGPRWLAIACSAVFAILLGALTLESHAGDFFKELTPDRVALLPLARALFSTYLLPFEIVGLLLLAAVIGATVLARPRSAIQQEEER